MIAGLPLSFTAPLVLGALVLLPALYFLLRIMPLPPKRVQFPPADLFLRPLRTETQAVRTPWWILLLRLLLLALVILAMAGPVWRPQAAQGSGPLLIVLDDSWPAAVDWEKRIALASAELGKAESAGRIAGLALLSQAGQDIGFGTAQSMQQRLAAIKPQPLLFDHLPLLSAIRNGNFPHAGLEIFWLSDGLNSGQARDFALGLAQIGALKVLVDSQPVVGVNGFRQNADGAQIKLLRSSMTGAASGEVQAVDAKGQVIATMPYRFDGLGANVPLDLPLDLRNQVALLELAGTRSTGAVFLLDDAHRRAKVGLFAEVPADVAQQPLLSAGYYLKRALTPFTELIEPPKNAFDPIGALLEAEPSLLILADVGTFTPDLREKLGAFVEHGGLLVRFAGPHVSGEDDPLLPVKLRRGGRSFGGALSWDKPKHLAPFEAGSPFNGLRVPDDVTVSRQILAEPDEGLPEKVWASLTDGTPLVTAERRGKGLIVLFHVSADTSWSNLALSGLFVDMLQRVTSTARQIGAGPNGDKASGDKASVLPPRQMLDGFGMLTAPSPQAIALPVGFDGVPDVSHPPGLYGAPEHEVALNALNETSALAALDVSGLDVAMIGSEGGAARDLRPILLFLALLLFLADTGVMLGLQRRLARGTAALAILMLGFGLILAPRDNAQAQQPAVPPAQNTLSPRDIEASLNVHLAYIITGDAGIDETSRLGLQSLSRVLARRTSVAPGEPIGLDPARDVLDLYPMIYWPVSQAQPLPSQLAVERLGTYLKQGGTVVFDTRDALLQRPNGPPTPEQAWLRQALRGLDLPELEPVPRDHVMTKTFYLLDGFAGRTTSGQTFVEALPPASLEGGARPVRAGDSVSPIVITSNDLAAAWAMDDNGRGLYPLIPGSPRQRELALRGGVNLVMYTLTGSYKADQVHMRALLERLRN